MSTYTWCKECRKHGEACLDAAHKPLFQWRADFLLGGRRGHRIRQLFEKKKDAETFEHTRTTDYLRDKYVPELADKDNVTFGAFADRYYNEHCIKNNRRPERSTKYRVRQAKAMLGSKILHEITRTDLRNLQSGLRAKDWEASTVNRFFTVLKAIFNKAREWEVLEKNPCEFIPSLPEKQPIPRFLTQKEINQLRAAAKDQRVQDFITLILHTGMRPGAIKELTWDQVDLENRRLHLVTYKGNRVHRYSVWIDNSAYELLVRRASVTRKSGFVLDTTNLRRLVQRAIQDSKINDHKPADQHFTIYGLKHSFASHLLMEGWHATDVGKVLGHADSKMVEKHYGYLTEDHTKKVQESINLTPDLGGGTPSAPSLPAVVRGVAESGD